MFSTVRRHSILSVDWDQRELRLVQAVARKGVVRIQQMLAVPVPVEVDVADPEALGGFLRRVLDQGKIRADRVVLDIPRDQILLATLNLPSASADEMPAVVEFQIAKELPFAVAEAVVDFAMPTATDEARVDVLVGTVRREVVAHYERVCSAAGLKLDRLGLRPYANMTAVNELYVTERYACMAMVDVGPRLTEIDVIVDGALAFSRAASVAVPPLADSSGAGSSSGSSSGPSSGSDSLDSLPSLTALSDDSQDSAIIRFPSDKPTSSVSQSDRVVNELLVEVTRSLEAYRATAPDKVFGLIVVGGGTGIEPQLAEAIERRFGASVELYNPARRYGWSADRGEKARAFAATLGLVGSHAAEEALDFDFLHPKKAVTVTERRLRKAPAVTAAAMLFLSAAIVFYMMSIAPKRRELRNTQEKIEAVKHDLKALHKIDDKVIAKADAFEAEQIIWLEKLEHIREQMPSNKQMVLTRIDMYHKGARINLQFEASKAEIADDVVARLDAVKVDGQKKPHFDATVKSTRTVSGRQYGTVGAIEVEIKTHENKTPKDKTSKGKAGKGR